MKKPESYPMVIFALSENNRDACSITCSLTSKQVRPIDQY